MDALQSLESKVRRLPRDEGGSVLLLSGMMAFLIAIMALFAMDTSQAVYNRITSQNAADAAAATAALWQARGLNQIQILNNFHYNINVAIFTAEQAELLACIAADGAVADFWADVSCCASIVGAIVSGGSCCDDIASAYDRADNLCKICAKAHPANVYQGKVASAILKMQGALSDAFPAMELTYASQAAQQSGADPILTVLTGQGGYLGSIISGLGSITGLNLPTGDIPQLPGLGIYALPLPPLPSSLSLNVQKVDGQYLPWRWAPMGPDVGYVDEKLMKIYAAADQIISDVACTSIGDPYDLYPSPDDWGWKDSYYQGHPGYMTWVAGKTNQTELAGLGMLRWLNGGQQTPTTMHYSLMNQDNLQWYMEGRLNSTSPLQIPAFIGLASSQVEGLGVIGKDISVISSFSQAFSKLSHVSSWSDFTSALGPLGTPPVDSTAHLIPVYFFNTSAKDVLIFH